MTLIVADLAVSREFYVDGLGWPVTFETPGEVVMVQVGDKLLFSLWQENKAVEELGPVVRPVGTFPFTLAHNVPAAADVDLVMAEAVAAGGHVVAEPVRRDWGGYTGYFADPDGFRWEIAYNPGPVGSSVL